MALMMQPGTAGREQHVARADHLHGVGEQFSGPEHVSTGAGIMEELSAMEGHSDDTAELSKSN
jgi:hypothetical protein